MTRSEIQCRVRAIDHVVITVSNIPETVRFYTQVLGMRGQQYQSPQGKTCWALLFGQTKIDLRLKKTTDEQTAAHPYPGTQDICFLTDAPLQAWLDHLDIHQVAVENVPSNQKGARSAIRSVFVRDPDRNLIEIAVPEIAD